MTSLAALVLVGVALCALLYPLLVRPRPRGSSSGDAASAELQEQYRGALADLQDAQTDWEVGNISEEEYEHLRDQYRRRAAQVLRQILVRRQEYGHSLSARAGEEPALSLPKGWDEGDRPVTPPLPDPPPRGGRGRRTPPLINAPPPGARAQGTGASGQAPELFRPPTPDPRPLTPLTPLIVGGAVAAVALAGIGVLYLRAVHSQAAQAPLATLPLAHAHIVAIDESGPIWVGHHGGLLQSADGREWRNVGVAGDVMAVMRVGQRRLVLGHDLLASVADEEGVWRSVRHDLPGTDVHGAQAVSGRLYAYVVGFGLFRSADGERWEQLSGAVPQDVGALAALSGQSGDMLFLAASGTVIRSPDGGRTWASAAGAVNLAITGAVRSIAADPERGALYAASSDGVFRSASAGADWVKLPFRGSAVAVGARGARVAVVDDRGAIFLSADSGATWTAER